MEGCRVALQSCQLQFRLERYITESRGDMKIFYFDGRGRAETARLALRLADKPFEDVRFKSDEWMSKYKPLSPTGQCPWLELDDGSTISQSLAIYLHCANIAGYLPSDPLQLAKTIELSGCYEDLMQAMGPTFAIKDVEEKTKARKAMMEPDGVLTRKLQVLEDLCSKVSTEYYCGDMMTLADLMVFVNVSSMRSGMLDGIEASDVDKYSKLAAMRSKIAALPKVKELYADQTGFEP